MASGTVRIPADEYAMLTSLAAMRGQSVSQLAREILRDGARRLLDPADIEKRMEEQKAVFLEAAARLQQEQ